MLQAGQVRALFNLGTFGEGPTLCRGSALCTAGCVAALLDARCIHIPHPP